MKRTKLETAVAEAHRFLERAEALLNVDEDRRTPYIGSDHRAASGAVKRSSMDLSRALSDLRRSN